MREFELTEQHLALMKNMFVSWWDCEYGAPAIDPKRPYGDSDVFGSMLKILNISIPGYTDFDELPPEIEEKLIQLHDETKTAIAIMLQCGKIQIGKYRADDYDDTTWEEA